MAIIQISKIQHRSGDLVDLPQLDEAEFGFASDARRLFIGKDGPSENIEVLTSYSAIDFNQIEGSVGNLNISNVANGEVLTYDGNNWVNRGGNAGGLITLGDVSNVKINGGALGYVLETDGTGNLSWTPKGIITLPILDISNTNPAVVTLVNEFSLTNDTLITINDIYGQGVGTDFANLLNGNSYYIQAVPGNSDQYTLYDSPSAVNPVDATGVTPPYPYAAVSATTGGSTNEITVSSTSPFAVTYPVVFLGNVSNTGLTSNTIYYVVNIVGGNSAIKVSETVGGNAVSLITQASLSATVYTPGGKISISTGGTGNGSPGSGNGTIQFNNGGIFGSDADLTWDNASSPKVLTANANVNTGNINANGTVTASRFVSNIATGTAPLTVSSTTRVSNLNVAYSNVTDLSVVTSQTTGTYYPVFVNSGGSGNLGLGSNANLSFNAATGNLSATLLTGTLTTTSQPNVTSVGTLTTLSVTGNANVGNIGATNGVLTGTLNVTGNANVGNLGTTTAVITTGNITTINSGLLQNGTSNVTLASGGNVSVFVAGNATARTIFTATGVNVAGTLNVTGNANVGNIGATNANLSAMTVTGNANVGNIGGTRGVFSTIVGSLETAAQPNITSVGSLSSLTVTANITAGNVYANSGTIGAALLTGTLTTAAQPNVTSLGTLSSLTATGNVNAGNLNTTSGFVGGPSAVLYGTTLTTGAAVTAGTITGNWTLSGGSRLQATYADLAEYYCSDGPYMLGTVLEFGGEQEVTLAGIESNRIAGVVSDQPAYVMNANITCEHPVPVALQGRVPCKVLGKVRKGDMMVSAGNGYAKAAITEPKMGTVIGKALADFDGQEGVIEVVVGRL